MKSVWEGKCSEERLVLQLLNYRWEKSGHPVGRNGATQQEGLTQHRLKSVTDSPSLEVECYEERKEIPCVWTVRPIREGRKLTEESNVCEKGCHPPFCDAICICEISPTCLAVRFKFHGCPRHVAWYRLSARFYLQRREGREQGAGREENVERHSQTWVQSSEEKCTGRQIGSFT